MFDIEYALSLANTDKDSLAHGLELFVVQYEPAIKQAKLYFLNETRNCLYKYTNGKESYQYFGDQTKNWRRNEPDYGSNLQKVADHIQIPINPKSQVHIDVVEDDDYYINIQAADRNTAGMVVSAVLVTYFIGSTQALKTINEINGTEWQSIDDALNVDGLLGIKVPLPPSKNPVKLYSKPFRKQIGGNLEFDDDTIDVLNRIYNGKFHTNRDHIDKGLIVGKEPRTGRTVIYCACNHVRSPR